MPYNSLNTIEDNLKRDIDLDFSPLKRRVKPNYNLTILDNNV